MATLNKTLFEAALAGLIAQRETIDNQIAEVRQYLDGFSTSTSAATTEETAPGKRKKFSAAARRKMAEAQKRRWAGIRSESVRAEAVAPVKKQKRKMSAAGRKAIAEATRKRWAEFRKAKAQR